mmetsp:Transcript_27754/g.36118  ORF Transcript_27754/g.36118 Transcript_27754/m.36118 type:complete len:419 (+) Transcript_27754:82-1338(+)
MDLKKISYFLIHLSLLAFASCFQLHYSSVAKTNSNKVLSLPHTVRNVKTTLKMSEDVKEVKEFEPIRVPLQPEVVCFGEALIDCIATPAAAGWDLERMIIHEEWVDYPGGAPTNCACALAKLGTKASLATMLGNDPEGEELYEVFSQHILNLDLVQIHNFDQTRRVMVTRDESGERTFAGFKDGMEADEFADCTYSFNRDIFMETSAKNSKWLVTGTLSLAFEGSRNAHGQIMDWAKKVGMKYYVDVNWRPVFWKIAETSGGEFLCRQVIKANIEQADMIKMTDEEAEWLIDIPAEAALNEPSKVKENFPNAKGVLITAGEKGAAYDILGHTGRVEGFNVDVVETTGAGDAFTAGFIHKMKDFDFTEPLDEQRKLQIDESVKFACAVGALTTCGEGAIDGQPRLKEVEAFLEAQTSPS